MQAVADIRGRIIDLQVQSLKRSLRPGELEALSEGIRRDAASLLERLCPDKSFQEHYSGSVICGEDGSFVPNVSFVSRLRVAVGEFLGGSTLGVSRGAGLSAGAGTGPGEAGSSVTVPAGGASVQSRGPEAAQMQAHAQAQAQLQSQAYTQAQLQAQPQTRVQAQLPVQPLAQSSAPFSGRVAEPAPRGPADAPASFSTAVLAPPVQESLSTQRSGASELPMAFAASIAPAALPVATSAQPRPASAPKKSVKFSPAPATVYDLNSSPPRADGPPSATLSAAQHMSRLRVEYEEMQAANSLLDSQLQETVGVYMALTAKQRDREEAEKAEIQHLQTLLDDARERHAQLNEEIRTARAQVQALAEALEIDPDTRVELLRLKDSLGHAERKQLILSEMAAVQDRAMKQELVLKVMGTCGDTLQEACQKAWEQAEYDARVQEAREATGERLLGGKGKEEAKRGFSETAKTEEVGRGGRRGERGDYDEHSKQGENGDRGGALYNSGGARDTGDTGDAPLFLHTLAVEVSASKKAPASRQPQAMPDSHAGARKEGPASQDAQEVRESREFQDTKGIHGTLVVSRVPLPQEGERITRAPALAQEGATTAPLAAPAASSGTPPATGPQRDPHDVSELADYEITIPIPRRSVNQAVTGGEIGISSGDSGSGNRATVDGPPFQNMAPTYPQPRSDPPAGLVNQASTLSHLGNSNDLPVQVSDINAEGVGQRLVPRGIDGRQAERGLGWRGADAAEPIAGPAMGPESGQGDTRWGAGWGKAPDQERRADSVPAQGFSIQSEAVSGERRADHAGDDIIARARRQLAELALWNAEHQKTLQGEMRQEPQQDESSHSSDIPSYLRDPLDSAGPEGNAGAEATESAKITKTAERRASREARSRAASVEGEQGQYLGGRRYRDYQGDVGNLADQIEPVDLMNQRDQMGMADPLGPAESAEPMDWAGPRPGIQESQDEPGRGKRVFRAYNNQPSSPDGLGGPKNSSSRGDRSGRREPDDNQMRMSRIPRIHPQVEEVLLDDLPPERAGPHTPLGGRLSPARKVQASQRQAAMATPSSSGVNHRVLRRIMDGDLEVADISPEPARPGNGESRRTMSATPAASAASASAAVEGPRRSRTPESSRRATPARADRDFASRKSRVQEMRSRGRNQSPSAGAEHTPSLASRAPEGRSRAQEDQDARAAEPHADREDGQSASRASSRASSRAASRGRPANQLTQSGQGRRFSRGAHEELQDPTEESLRRRNPDFGTQRASRAAPVQSQPQGQSHTQAQVQGHSQTPISRRQQTSGGAQPPRARREVAMPFDEASSPERGPKGSSQGQRLASERRPVRVPVVASGAPGASAAPTSSAPVPGVQGPPGEAPKSHSSFSPAWPSRRQGEPGGRDQMPKLPKTTVGLSDSAIENLLAGRPAFSGPKPASPTKETDPAEYSDGFSEKPREDPEASRKKALQRLRDYEEKERARRAAEVSTRDVLLQKRDQRIEQFRQKQQERQEQERQARAEGVSRSMGASRGPGTPHQRMSGSRLSKSICKNRFDVEEEEARARKAEIERRRNSEIHDYLRESRGGARTPVQARSQVQGQAQNQGQTLAPASAGRRPVGPKAAPDRQSRMIATVLDELEEDLFG